MEKFFTVREADSLLPKVESILQHMDVLLKRTHELAAVRPAPASEPSALEIAESARIRSQMEFLLQAVEEDIQIVSQLGGVVKDVEKGLVDFLGRVDGEEVWLCWKRGETRINFWHPLHTGFSDRQILKRSEDRTTTTH